jgi:HAD superfamily hydrolase (TIGR01490 family)
VRDVKLAIFDVDHTLVNGSTGLYFALYMARNRHIPLTHVAVAAWWTFGHRMGFVNADTMVKGGASVFAGMSRAQILQYTEESFRDYIRPRVYPEARETVAVYHRHEIPTLALSGTGDLMVKRIAEDFDIPDYIGNRVEWRGDISTGVPLEPFSYGQGKLLLLDEFLRERGLRFADCAAFADSRSDLPLLSAVGYPHAVNPDRKLYETATRRGWPILRFG